MKRWTLLNKNSVPKLRKRMEMVTNMEKCERGFSREFLFHSSHLIGDDGQFITYLLKVAGVWNLDYILPDIANRINLFAELLNVTPEDVVAEVHMITLASLPIVT